MPSAVPLALPMPEPPGCAPGGLVVDVVVLALAVPEEGVTVPEAAGTPAVAGALEAAVALLLCANAPVMASGDKSSAEERAIVAIERMEYPNLLRPRRCGRSETQLGCAPYDYRSNIFDIPPQRPPWPRLCCIALGRPPA